MYTRRFASPGQSYFLLGPRGCGKTTWLRATFKDAYFVDLLSEDRFQRLLVDPGRFADELRAVPPGRWVVLDEVQRLPALLNEVHHFIEEKRLQFVLCGSSLLPLVWDSSDRTETLTAYGQLYLKEEIQAEAVVRNLPGFARFLPIAALCHGQAMNITNIAREAGVARTTVAGYLDILEETLLCFRVPGFEPKLRLRERKLPKWYWCDPGIVRAMRRSHGPLVPEERGALFEGLVAQLLRAYRDYTGFCDDIT